ESQKFNLWTSENIIVKDYGVEELGRLKVSRSPLITTDTGTKIIPVMYGRRYGKVHSVRIVAGDGFTVTGTVSLGINGVPGFYVNAAALSNQASGGNATLPLANNRIHNDNRGIFATIDIS